MKKKQNVRILSFILILTVVLIVPVNAMEQGAILQNNSLNIITNNSGRTTVGTIYDENGDPYDILRIITTDYSKAITTDKNDNVVAEFTFVFDEQLVYDMDNNVVMNMSEDIEPNINEGIKSTALASDLDWHYMGSFTGYFEITTASGAILATMIVAAFPSITFAAAVTIAGILIEAGLNQVYYVMKMYSATDDDYQYIKRVIQFYTTRGGDKLGSPVEGIQKKALDAA